MSLLSRVEHARSSHPQLPPYSHDLSKLSIIVKTSHNLHNIVAIDIGGTLAKVVFTEKNESGDVVLQFAKFDSADVDSWLSFVSDKLKEIQSGGELKMTGGGSVKYGEIIKNKFKNATLTHVDEMKSLANGICFLGTIPEEVFTFNTTSNSVEDQPLLSLDASAVGESIFPGLVANIGSGVSFVACTSPSEFKRVGGTPLGGGSYAGLCHMMAGCTNFEEVVKANEEITNNPQASDENNIDLLVGDIYGTSYGAVGLSSSAVASSFGKAGLNLGEKALSEKKVPSKTDVINSVTLMTCWNIGQQGGLWAQHVGAKHVLFGGYLVRNQTNVMKYLALSVGRIGGIKPLFMVHAGFLGVLGAFFA